MQTDNYELGTEIQNLYQVDSHREIVSILRAIGEKRQLVRMIINRGTEVVLTTVLAVDEETVIIDCARDPAINKVIADAEQLSFETSLDKISVSFTAKFVEPCIYEGSPAFQFDVPSTLTRLQRREFYRINTPLTNPLRCAIPMPEDIGGGIYSVSLVDISCGGIAILDDKKVLDKTIGRDYYNCKLDLTGIGSIVTTLQVRNSQEMALLNGKTTRRLGCQFINLPNSMLNSVQRYIMKLERERNAKVTGLG
jgi:flagellar brake protein